MPSLESGLKGIENEILVVDNRSEDDSVIFLKRNYPNVKLTINKIRKGYGANHNINLARAKGKYIVFMNADIIIVDDALKQLKDFMECRPEVGISCPNVFNKDETLQYLNKRHPTLLDLFLRRFKFFFTEKFVERRSCHYEMRDSSYETSVDVPFISGCFMFCRTRIVQMVNGFDERFFLYFEDADLCREVQNTNRTVSCPEGKVIHGWHRSAHKELKWFLVFIKSAFLYFNKWGYRFF